MTGRPGRAGRAGRAALALLAAAALGGCRGGDAAVDPASVRGLDAGSTSVRAPSDRSGGTLRLVTGAVDSLDPTRSYSPGVWNVMRLYTRQLVTFAPEPGVGGTRVVPDLATSLGVSRDGGQTWTYRLRPGVRWEDGTPLTSRDVKYGIQRLFASDVLPGGPTWALGLLDLRGAPYDGPYRDRTRGRLGLKTVQTPDDRTVIFTLNRPFAAWDQVLALPASSPVPARKDTGAKYGARPLSLGPYRTRGVGAGGVVTFERNRHWSRQLDPVRPARPDRIQLATGLLPDERDRRVLAGEADADVSGSGLQPAGAGTVLADPALAARADDPTTGTVRYLAMPRTVAPFDNVHCRRAVQHALDKAAVKEALGGTYAAALATTLWPRALPGYPATAPYPTGEGNRGDPAAARAALARCGEPEGFSTTLGTVSGGRGEAAAGAVSRALARVGIRATVRTYPRSTFLSSVAGAPAVVRSERLGLILGEWAADFPSPYAFLVPLADGRSVRPTANPNPAELSDPAIQRSVDTAAATSDPVQAAAVWRRIADAVMAQAGYAPLVEDRALLIGSERLRNAYVHPAYHGYDVVALGVQ